ncbi:hypothetical protein V8C42DRAFT_311094 [Trichoderma barbatum]
MHLHALPPELLRLVLTSFDSLHDLHSLIRASSHCFRIFQLSPELILSSILKRAIHPDALYHALAVARVESYRATNVQDSELLWQFLDRYFQRDPTLLEFPIEMNGITSLARLYNMVSNLANDYMCRTLQALYANEEMRQDANQSSMAPCARHVACQDGLSVTEKARLQRAFFRYELYSRCFPVSPESPAASIFPAEMQFNRFLQYMEPWEVEELSCLHEYFWVQVSGIFSDVEEEIVAKVLDAQPAAGSTVTTGQQEQSDTNHRLRLYTSADGDGMCLFEFLDLHGLDLFSESERSEIPDILRYMVSLGLSFLQSLIFGSSPERRDLIRRHDYGEREFLPHAIYEDPNPSQAPKHPESVLDDDICHLNLGYLLFRPSSIEAFLSAMGIARYWPLRRLGYVFWDIGRILEPDISRKLRDARDCEPIAAKKALHKFMKKSAEFRLKGIKLPQTLMREIEDDYGQVTDDGFELGSESAVPDSEEDSEYMLRV